MNYNYKDVIAFVSVLYLGLTSNFSIAETAKPPLSFTQEIEKISLEELSKTGTPSLQISIGLGDNIVYEGAFGFADIENKVKATSTSEYRIASVAKWLTASLAMKLVEAGSLDLDKPVHTYCPEFPQKKKGVITSRQLLTHTSGIRHYFDYETAIKSASTDQLKAELTRKMLQEEVSSYTRYTDVISPLKTFENDELLFAPGSNWEYSSFGYRLLACSLQGATKTKYAKLMEEMIFKPVHMDNTMPDDAWAIIPNRVTGYRLDNGKLRRADLRDVSENLPAGGYLSTASDLVKFSLAFNSGLVSDKSKKLMSSPVGVSFDSNSDPSWRDAIPQRNKYGYGLMLLSKYEDGMIGHTGRQAGASSVVVLIPKDKLAIAVLTNAKGWNSYLNFVMKIETLIKHDIENGSFNKSIKPASNTSID